jgi:hypothetical protein
MKNVYFEDDKTYGTIPRQRIYNNNKNGVINYLLNKGIVHTRLGANFLLLIAFFAISGLTSFLWNGQQVDMSYVTDEYGKTYHINDYVKKIEMESSNKRLN